MAINDKELYMSDAQDLAKAAASYDSTNTINAQKDGDALATPGCYWILKVTETFVGAGATLAAKLQHATVASFADVPGMSVAATAISGLTAGTILAKIALPIGMKANIKTVYTIGTATTTAGKVESYITSEVDVH